MKKAADNSGWKDGFLFVGNELILDFVNTRPVQDGEPAELLKDFRAVLRWFRAAGVLDAERTVSLERKWAGTAIAVKTTEALKELREKLRAEILAWERGRSIRSSTVNELNGLLGTRAMLTRLVARGNAVATELWFEVREPEDLFAPLAHNAATFFATADRERVRKCDNCVLLFRDTSKKGTRRWCSMQLCGNRFKVAAYAVRQRTPL